jgi:hypothetical protein
VGLFDFGKRVSLRAQCAILIPLAFLAVLSPIVVAETVQIHLNGFAFDYANGKIYDDHAVAGGHLDPNEATLISTADFFRNGSLNPVASINSSNSTVTSVYVDLLLNSVSGIPSTQGFGSFSDGNSFGIDLFEVDHGTTIHLLRTTLTTGSIWYDGLSQTVGFSGLVKDIVEQHLPASLQLSTSDNVTFSFSSAKVTNIAPPVNGFLTSFTAFGTGDFNGTLVPEPSMLSLSSAALLGLIWFSWRRTKYGRSQPST